VGEWGRVDTSSAGQITLQLACKVRGSEAARGRAGSGVVHGARGRRAGLQGRLGVTAGAARQGEVLGGGMGRGAWRRHVVWDSLREGGQRVVERGARGP
jgi:hypothetical protein